MTELPRMAERRAYAIIEITVPLLDVAVEDSMWTKQEATAAVAERVLDALPEDLAELVSGRWEDSPALETMPIEALEIGLRPLRCLQRAGMRTVGDIMMMPHRDFVALPGFGLKSRREVEIALRTHGLAPYGCGFAPRETPSMTQHALVGGDGAVPEPVREAILALLVRWQSKDTKGIAYTLSRLAGMVGLRGL
jgi:hypothetical protein